MPDWVVVHISDIHFLRNRSGTTYLDADLRNEVEQDLERMIGELGRLDAIAVTGDVAFSGRSEEYEQAAGWLKHISGSFGCSTDSIMTIPGNHDVFLGALQDNTVLSLIHQQLRKVEVEKLDNTLVAILENDLLGTATLQPLDAYAQFADQFGCGISRARPFWEKDFTLNDGSTLRVRGLTSTLVSDLSDQEGHMILGMPWATLTREPGVEYMVMCHHPIDWFRERDQLEEMLTSRARILLFGHKHMPRLRRLEDTVSLTAGAVHPFRDERVWQPRYHVLRLKVDRSANRRALMVQVYTRVWSPSSTAFEAENFRGSSAREFAFEIPKYVGGGAVHAALPAHLSDQEVVITSAAAAVEVVGGGTTLMDTTLALAQRFWQMPYHVRMKTLRDLGVAEDLARSNLPEDRQVALAFRLISERRMLDALRDSVDRYYSQIANP